MLPSGTRQRHWSSSAEIPDPRRAGMMGLAADGPGVTEAEPKAFKSDAL